MKKFNFMIGGFNDEGGVKVDVEVAEGGSDDEDPLGGGIIALIVILCIIFLGMLGYFLFTYWKSRDSHKNLVEDQEQGLL